jgi:hypothetical protein
MKRFRLFTLLLCLGALSLGAQVEGDAFEPNDSAAGAYALNGMGRFNLNFPPDNEDWLSFRLSAPGESAPAPKGTLIP